VATSGSPMAYSSDMFQAQQDAQRAGRPFSIGYATPREGAVTRTRLDGAAQDRPAPDLAHRS